MPMKQILAQALRAAIAGGSSVADSSADRILARAFFRPSSDGGQNTAVVISLHDRRCRRAGTVTHAGT